MEQIPIVPQNAYQSTITGGKTVSEFITEQVIRLTYNSLDLAEFAREMRCAEGPYNWDDDDRFHRKAMLDALYFRLYGLDQDAASHVLDSFSGIQKHENAMYGHYRTKESILSYMRAHAAGDFSSRVIG